MTEYLFPEGFLWGGATSSHQVEGGNTNNDWWAHEQEPGTVIDGSISGDACDHYRRFPEDFALLKQYYSSTGPGAPTTVPEPTTIVLIGAGVLSILSQRKPGSR